MIKCSGWSIRAAQRTDPGLTSASTTTFTPTVVSEGWWSWSSRGCWWAQVPAPALSGSGAACAGQAQPVAWPAAGTKRRRAAGDRVGGTRRWPYGSTARVRALVLLALGVVKVATAAQLRALVLPGTVDAQTVRNACKDLKGAGLVESVGSTSRPGKAGQPVTEQLWNLTTAGLAAAATELDRPVREMGGTARDAAKAGAAHALKVTDTIDAFRQSEPLPTKRVARTQQPGAAAAVPAQPAAGTRPPGLGKLRGWMTEVALPVVGTFTAPGRGSLRADAVLTAPEDGVPVLFVEVDNHTEPPAAVADKIARYRKFFQRSAKDHLGRDVPLWSTLWEDSGLGGFPSVALVFTKPVGPRVMQERIGEVGRLSQEHWQGRWHTDYTSPGRQARRLPRLRRRARARHHPGPARRQGTARAGVMALRPQCGRDPGAGPRHPRRPPRLPPTRRRAPRRP